MKKNNFEILNTNQKQKEWNYMNSAKNVTLEWVRRHVGPTCRRLMRHAPASRLGPLLVWIEFLHEISPMRPE
jgi:hypothetical protein